ncbi:hypothetical protein [Cellvibrio polysaccharolyticus]|uniref:Uncharacterized protein n=1 Tax=Cellvibrio polysaccharolyticus TaxID=2082724 RepID=A0A928UZZ4_9GAMM|nr:hypothetical protein [Cellvibrio polysaccharolyticus]MBE8716320.1 hypothetical protein [Cellvibrio polysaccharolyticus]
MMNSKIKSFAVALGLSAWAVAALVLTEMVGKFESVWIFFAVFLVSILSMIYSDYIESKKSTQSLKIK